MADATYLSTFTKVRRAIGAHSAFVATHSDDEPCPFITCPYHESCDNLLPCYKRACVLALKKDVESIEDVLGSVDKVGGY